MIAVGQRELRDALVGTPLAAHETDDVAHDGCLHGHEAVLVRDFVLPADPRHRVPVAQQKAVAKIFFGGRVRDAHRAVEHAERDLAAAVGDIEEERTVAAANGPKKVEVGRAFDEAARVARRVREIGDVRVNGVLRVNGKPERPFDLFVGAGAAERTTSEHGLTTLDLELRGGHRHPPVIARLRAG